MESPLDVLEVFTRINLGGVEVGGTDVYLAAVKTFWNEAEHGSTGSAMPPVRSSTASVPCNSSHASPLAVSGRATSSTDRRTLAVGQPN